MSVSPTTPAEASVALSPPSMSEIEAALAAGGPTAQRRRRSSGGFSVLSQPQHRSRPPPIGDGRRKEMLGAPDRKGGGRSAGGEGIIGEAGADAHPPAGGKKFTPSAASSRGREKGRDQAGSLPSPSSLLVPATHAQRAGVRATTPPLTVSLFSCRGSGSGTSLISSATPSSQPPLGGAPPGRLAMSEPRRPSLGRSGSSASGVRRQGGFSASARQGGGGGGGLGAGTSKAGQSTGAAEPRIPMKAFERCGGGNFAAYLALRWNSSNGGNGCGENGFEMLARFALEGASLALFSSSSSRPLARDGATRGVFGQGWKDPVDRKMPGSKGVSSLLGGGSGLPSSGRRGIGHNGNSTNSRKWWTSGEWPKY